MKLIIIIHILGLFIFNLMGLIGSHEWETIYYLWDKSVGAGFLIWVLLYNFCTKDKKWMIKPVMILAAVRFVWQMLVYFTGWDINNQWWLALFFVLLSAGAGYLVLHENSRGNKWLSKHLNI